MNAASRHGPKYLALVFSTENLPFQLLLSEEVENVRPSAYVLVEPDGEPRALIIATGSEVALAVAALYFDASKMA